MNAKSALQRWCALPLLLVIAQTAYEANSSSALPWFATVSLVGCSTIAVWLAVNRLLRSHTRAVVARVTRSIQRGEDDPILRYAIGNDAAQVAGGLAHLHGEWHRKGTMVDAELKALVDAACNLVVTQNDVAYNAQELADVMRRTQSTTEKLAASVSKSADSSTELSELAASAALVASEGGELVRKVVATMDSIRLASTRIVDIIGVIDDLTYQTNILALNAAVEAARAGEQGRGFAVVASEVRHLAKRSAAAAKEIQQLIQRSVQQVGEGAELTHATGSTMDDIVTRIGRVNEIMRSLDVATQQEAQWFDEIVAALARLDAIADRNLEQVSGQSQSAGLLATQISELSQNVA